MSAGGILKVGGVLLLATAAVGGTARLAGLDLGFGGESGYGLDGAEARRGDLRISVVERANLKAANSSKLKCDLEGRSTILWLIEEGTIVEEGEVVCELDTSSQMERKVAQEISVQNAVAAFTKAEQNLKIQESQNESDIKSAEQALEFAKQDQHRYVNGELPQLTQAADEAILLAEEDLKRKESELDWSRKLSEKDFLTRTQLEADEFAYNSSRVLLEQRKREKQLLIEYDKPRRLLELSAAIEEAERELDRVKLQAAARIADFEADFITSEAKRDLEQDELEKLLDQIEKAVMRAPVGGMVVYAKEGGGRWGSNEPIQEGTEVRERQEIITIPSSEGMIAEMTLHESVLEKVREGMPCLIMVDALPGRQFTGRVRFKSTLPDQNSWWANPDLRVYRTEIEVVENTPELKSGMSCSVEVVVDDLVDVLHVPVQSVFLNRGKPACFVAEGGGVELREVEVGQDNGKWVEVFSGLSEGEVVLLSQPAGTTLEPADEDDVSLDEIPEMERAPEGGGSGQPSWGGGSERGGRADAGRRGGSGKPASTGRPSGSSGGKRPSGSSGAPSRG
ncbi:MAG: hypothetical protein AAF682_13860 [Planctomycetota bacterium]